MIILVVSMIEESVSYIAYLNVSLNVLNDAGEKTSFPIISIPIFLLCLAKKVNLPMMLPSGWFELPDIAINFPIEPPIDTGDLGSCGEFP